MSRIRSVAELATFIQKSVLPRLTERQVILLRGEMGAGKTEFVKQLAFALGSREAASPSFAVHHVYETLRGPLDHLDLYRLGSLEDLDSIGFWDLFARARGLVVIEWAEKLTSAQLPYEWAQMRVEFVMDDTSGDRKIEVT